MRKKPRTDILLTVSENDDTAIGDDEYAVRAPLWCTTYLKLPFVLALTDWHSSTPGVPGSGALMNFWKSAIEWTGGKFYDTSLQHG